jgi:hypothetical protein
MLLGTVGANDSPGSQRDTSALGDTVLALGEMKAKGKTTR